MSKLSRPVLSFVLLCLIQCGQVIMAQDGFPEEAARISDDDIVLEALPADVLATMEARDKWFASLSGGDDLGDAFHVSLHQRWVPGSTVTVAFLGGTTELHEEIAAAAEQISDACNLTLDFGLDESPGEYRTWSTSDTDYVADIRVSFDRLGNFSLIGRDSVTPTIGSPFGAVGGRPNQRSLNLGGFHIQKPQQWKRTVRHEFLHALAFRHEHQSPEGGCDAHFRWEDDPDYQITQDSQGRFIPDPDGDRPGIYTYLSGFPNFWDRQKVDHNLREHEAGSGTSGSFDRRSIMLYRFPALFYRTHPSPCAPLGDSEHLSEGDRDGLALLYPASEEDVEAIRAQKSALEKSFERSDAIDTETKAALKRVFTEPQPTPAEGQSPQGRGDRHDSDGAANAPTEEQWIEDEVRAFRARRVYSSNAGTSRTFGPKVVYGPDDRRDIVQLDDGHLHRALATSTCLLTSDFRVQEQGDNFLMHVNDWKVSGLDPCSGERFRLQKTGGWCSGFLVGPDLVATAGHCCANDDDDVKQIAFIFGFYAEGPLTAGSEPDEAYATMTPSELQKDQVYFGKKVVAHRLSSQGDFAVIQLDRAVTFSGAQVLTVSDDEPVAEMNVGMVGYPAGLPCKASFGEETKVSAVETVWLKTNLDAYGGNSGSAVFDADGAVVGILVRGNPDYNIHDNTCFFTNQLDESEAGEIVTRASAFSEFIP